jgi:glyoxalase-like protein
MAVRCEFDHVVVACADLDQGAAWIRARLGADVVPGGRHAAMGTHNRLLRIGPRAYLEVIAIEPGVPPPPRPRWFDLDTPAVRQRAARSPFVATWVVRTDDVTAAAREVPAVGEVLPFTRSQYRWQLTVPSDGALQFDGLLPSVIQWEGAMHPADSLPNAGCELLGLSLTHPRIEELRMLLAPLGVQGRAELTLGAPQIAAHVRVSGAVRVL